MRVLFELVALFWAVSRLLLGVRGRREAIKKVNKVEYQPLNRWHTQATHLQRSLLKNIIPVVQTRFPCV